MRSSSLFALAAAGAAFAAQDPPAPTFSTGTKLVQVSVVAEDRQGKPVADLRPEEFHVFDNGTAREIRLFVAEKATNAPPEPKAPNTFTNQIVSAGPHSGYSVILIDNLLTDFGDPFKDSGSANARLSVLRMLRSIPIGEQIAIYQLQRPLQIICEFTSDRELLERQLGVWIPNVDTPATTVGAIEEVLEDAQADVARANRAAETAPTEAVRAMAMAHVEEAGWRAAALKNVVDGVSHADTALRVDASNNAMELVADHLTSIPGRKNLIWLSTRFLISPQAVQKFSGASVSIYPVDINGVCAHCSGTPIVAMNAMAAQTGGVAYYGRNDVDVAIREAIDDGRVSYTLGFYQTGDGGPAQIHQIGVSVNRPDVTLRYRTSYRSEAARTDTARGAVATAKVDLVKAMNNPANATAIPVKASVKRSQDRLTLEALLDTESLDLVPEQSLWKGSIEVVARFTTADGRVAGAVLSQTMNLNLRQATFEEAVRNGLAYRNELKVPAKAVELKLMFANMATGKIGTVAIPLAEIK